MFNVVCECGHITSFNSFEEMPRYLICSKCNEHLVHDGYFMTACKEACYESN